MPSQGKILQHTNHATIINGLVSNSPSVRLRVILETHGVRTYLRV